MLWLDRKYSWLMREMTITINCNLRNAIAKGIIVGVITAISYLLVVVFTTPNLSPMAAINAALKANSIIIFGLAAGVGIQIFLSTYGKNLGCRINKKRNRIVGNSGSTAVSSVLSFFSLVPLGCCGSWLLLLSLLPSVFGSTFSVILIQFSKPLSYFGLSIVFAFTVFTALKLIKELKERDEAVIKRIKVPYDSNGVKGNTYSVEQN
jgi:hypothetical protein